MGDVISGVSKRRREGLKKRSLLLKAAYGVIVWFKGKRSNSGQSIELWEKKPKRDFQRSP